MYLLAWTPMGIAGTGWLWILLGLFLDFSHYAQAARHRDQVPGYSTAAAAVAGGTSAATPPPPPAPADEAAPDNESSGG
jgi:hypothetical protein